MRLNFRPIGILALFLGCFLLPSSAKAQFTIDFGISDFSVTDVFGQLTTFDFEIDVASPLVAGQIYNDPTLNGVVYNVSGVLDQTPSGFAGFNLMRTIGGQEFYNQGSSLNFEVSATANLFDGLQASELVADATGLIFEFNGRELNTGRFHPTLIRLFANGTGTIQNSNNTGGVNPFSNTVVNVDFGDEFIADLSFSSNFTLAEVLLGDVDLSGDVTFADIPPFIQVLKSGVYQAEADVDQDGDVDFQDITPFVAILSEQ